MRKSLFDEPAKEEVISRIFQLKEDHQRQWGLMEVTQMMHHLNTSLKITLSGKTRKEKSTIKQWFFKNVFLYVLHKFPKDVPTSPDIDVVGSRLDTNSFEEERTELIRLLNQFQRTKQINAIHPYFGNLNTRDWGI